MSTELFTELETLLREQGANAAIDQLCAVLRQRRDHARLFYALLVKKRQELGVSPIPTEPADSLPPEFHQPYEEAIRAAAREVGQLYLEDGNIPQAWLYFRMIGEPAPVAAALDRFQPSEDEDLQPIIDVAFQQAVHPRKGFDLVLDRYGTCNAITMIGGIDFGKSTDVRTYCIGRLVRQLHRELVERVRADITHRQNFEPTGRTIPELLAGREWLFDEECYHIDTSHLSSVVQMSIHLPPGDDLRLAIELCEYGRHLSPRLQYPGDPPFENLYLDYGHYLRVLAGDNVEAGLDHFRAKVEVMDVENLGTLPAEVLVNLLLQVNRTEEALAVARRWLGSVRERPLTCPSIAELCQRAGNYQALADVAREQEDPVHFLAGLLATKR